MQLAQFIVSLFAIGFASTLSAQSLQKKEKTFLADFEQNDKSTLAKRLLQIPNVSYAKGKGKDGSNCVRVAYVGGQKGSARIVADYKLGFSAKKATLSFDVQFEPGFVWVKGGKLHGLGPNRPVTGGQPTRPNGWSARMMFKDDGRCSAYLYEQKKDFKWGIGSTTKEPVFEVGKWHHVRFEVLVNDPGHANGHAKFWIDGTLQNSEEKIEFRGKGDNSTLIQRLLFHTFHGGNTPAWAPTDKEGNFITVHALYDNISVVGE